MRLTFLMTLTAMLCLSACGGSSRGPNPPPPQPPGPPTITLAPLPAGALNRTVGLSADVTAPAGVARVEFLVDDVVVGTSTSSPYSFAWDTSTASNGAHTVSARVTDATNRVATSATANVSVNNNPTINVALKPDQIIPRPISAASGFGNLTFDLISGVVTGSVSVTGTRSEVTMVHIHEGVAGVDGQILIHFDQDASDATRWNVRANSTLSGAQIDKLLTGELFVNVHSGEYQTGELRAQIQPQTIEVVFSALSGDAIVPPVTIDAGGVVVATIDNLARTVTVHAYVQGVDDASEVHIHKAPAGESSTVTFISLTQDSAATGHWFVERHELTSEDLEDYTGNGGWYIDVHTPANPGGAIRGQITPDSILPPVPSLTHLQETIFSVRCAGCHNGTDPGGSLPQSMNLTSVSASYAALVGVQAERSALLRVQPGNADDSFLVRKIAGTLASGEGARMPFGCSQQTCLSPSQIDQVRAWIDAGAPLLLPPSESLPNDFQVLSDVGASASFSEEGIVNRADAFHTPQGNNGRSCATCHAAEAGWTVTPAYVSQVFDATGGLDPLFNTPEANAPGLDVSTAAKRRQAYSMLLNGLFRRGGTPPEDRDYDIVAAEDPHGVGSTSTFSFYRRPLTIANLKLMAGVHWDGRFNRAGDAQPPRLGLFAQARGNIINGQSSPPPGPAPSDELVNEIVEDELQLWHAQSEIAGIGRLDTCGGRGGPEILSTQPHASGPFDLFDAWVDFVPQACDARDSAAQLRAQIARGQEIFNTRGNEDGVTCQSCHDSANNGSNTQDSYFDIGVSGAERRTLGMPIYTLRRRCPDAEPSCEAEEKLTTDPGRALITGRFDDVNKFKVPTLRGAAARAPYFHNGSAQTLRDVVRHYSDHLGFSFTQREEDDLVVFLNAL